MSAVEEPKKSFFDKFSKKQKREFAESVLVVIVSLVLIFYYPKIRWAFSEGKARVLCYYSPPEGHEKPLGAHRPPELNKLEETTEWPTPTQFFDDFVSESKPVVLRTVGRSFKAYNVWSDEYLRKVTGKQIINFKNPGGYNLTTVDSFLESYQESAKHLYDQVPLSIIDDLCDPASTRCGQFQSAFKEVIFWMNGGNLTLGLNAESLDTIHCAFDGSQTLILVDRLWQKLAEEGVSDSLELENLDLCRKRNLRYLPYYDVSLAPGDCIFIPSRWYKQITFQSPRNIGVIFRYFRMLYFNLSDCEDKSEEALGSSNSLRRFDKDGRKKYEILSLAENHATLDIFTFQKVFRMPGVNDPQSLKQLFTLLDTDEDNEISPEELYSLQADELLKFFPGFKTEDNGGHRPKTDNVTTNTSDEKMHDSL